MSLLSRLNQTPIAAKAGIAAVLLGIVFLVPPGDRLERLSYDLSFSFLPPVAVDNVVLIQMDESSRAALNQTAGEKWDRSLHARLLEKLKEDNARLAVFDVYFDEADFSAKDQALAKAITNFHKVVLTGTSQRVIRSGPNAKKQIISVLGQQPSPPAFLLSNSIAWGVSTVLQEDDRIVRRQMPESTRYISLAWAAAHAYGAKVTEDPANRIRDRWIRYYGEPGSVRSVSYNDALTNLASGRFTDKVVFIGGKPQPLAPGAQADTFGVPSGATMTGVELAATMFLNIVNGDSLRRISPFTELGMLIVAGIAFGFGLSRLKPLNGALLGLTIAILVFAAAMLLLRTKGLWFNWLVISAVQLPVAFLCAAVAYTQKVIQEKETLEIRIKTIEQRDSAETVDESGSPPRAPLPPEGVTDPGTLVEIPNYKLIKHIGGGSFGDVWLARGVTRSYFAAKIVSRKNFPDAAPYQREFNGLLKFEPITRNHPGWVNILYVGQDERAGCFYYVMEAADDVRRGQNIEPNGYAPKTLGTVLAEKERLPIRECVELGILLADALEALHRQKLIHRDIKPANIIYVHHKPKLADIGLVADIRQGGSIVGTMGYMPERGLRTASADIFSLGRVLYQAATGAPPERHPGLPTSLGDRSDQRELMRLMGIINKACEYEVKDRYQSASEFKADLEKLLCELPDAQVSLA